MFFKDRLDAGRQLCKLLEKYKNQSAVVYAIPRGGVVVAEEIAKFLHAPMDLLLSHKIGHPYQPEYAIAAVSESGRLVWNPRERMSIDENWLEKEKNLQIQEIKRKRKEYLKGRKEISLQDKIAIIVDDGIATGLTIQAGIEELKDKHPKKIVIAVPVAPKRTANLLKALVDDFVAIDTPEDFLGSVGSYYEEFYQVEDEEVIAALEKYRKSSVGSF